MDALAEIAHLDGDLADQVDQLRDAVVQTQGQRDPWIRGEIAIWLWRAKALSALPEGCAEPYRFEAAGQWREAAAAWDRLGCPYEHACMLAWYGDETAQREALEKFESLGAAPAAQRLRRQMRAGGARRVPRGSRASTRQNSFGLTRREAQVLDLMRSGLRNSAIAKRLYLSTRTIDHHVSAVLAKLGASTRAEAVAIASRETAGSE
jgi:DNA-binding CsgD family transcriptional regulator